MTDTATTYTYSIYDGNPAASGGCTLPDHEDLEIEADSDEDARFDVELALEVAAAGLSVDDGYAVGDVLYALVWDADGEVVATLTYTLTAEDLGL